MLSSFAISLLRMHPTKQNILCNLSWHIPWPVNFPYFRRCNPLLCLRVLTDLFSRLLLPWIEPFGLSYSRWDWLLHILHISLHSPAQPAVLILSKVCFRLQP